MRTAHIFPGQGSQYPGMGQDLYESFPAARTVFEEASDLLGYDLAAYCFADADEGALTETNICQAAILTHAMAAHRVLGQAPEAVAGHSVGEYAALIAAGALSFADGLGAVKVRATLMAQAGKARRGAMSAILNLDVATVENICQSLSMNGHVVQPANLNSPGQIVISGDADTVKAAAAAAAEQGARRVIPLKVSGAFHSPLMQEVIEPLAAHVATLEINPPRCPVYMNCTGRPTMDPEEIRANIVHQVTAPVLWADTLDAMHTDGIERFIELGPGRVLSGLVRRTLGRSVTVMNVGRVRDVVRHRAPEPALA